MAQKTIGQVLKETRTKADLTLDAAERLTNIKKLYISALESGNYEVLPGPFYVRAYLKQYVQRLGLDVNEILTAYDAGELLEEEDPLSNTGNYRFVKPAERVKDLEPPEDAEDSGEAEEEEPDEEVPKRKGWRQYLPLIGLSTAALIILAIVFGVVIASSLNRQRMNANDYSLSSSKFSYSSPSTSSRLSTVSGSSSVPSSTLGSAGGSTSVDAPSASSSGQDLPPASSVTP